MMSRVQKQKGAVLLISMMLLIVMTVLTLTVSESFILQEKMTQSTKDSELALQVAEAALLEAEARVRGMNLAAFNSEFVVDGSNATSKGFFDGTSCDGSNPNCHMNKMRGVFSDTAWVNATNAVNGVSCGTSDAACRLTGQFMVVKLGPLNATATGAQTLEAVTNQYQSQSTQTMGQAWRYKIVARGWGNNRQNTRVLVSYFAQSQPAI